MAERSHGCFHAQKEGGSAAHDRATLGWDCDCDRDPECYPGGAGASLVCFPLRNNKHSLARTLSSPGSWG